MSIDHRIARLEATNRRHRFTIITLLLLILAGIVVGQSSPPPKTLSVEHLIIHDSQGRPRIELSCRNDDHPHLYMFDPTGARRVALAVAPLGNSVLALNGPDGHTFWSASVDLQNQTTMRPACNCIDPTPPAVEATSDKPATNPSPQTSTADDGPQASTDNVPKSYRRTIEFLRELPKELQPHPANGWDKYTSPRVSQWLRENLAGKQFSAVYAVKHVHTSRRADNKWQIMIQVEEPSYKYGPTEYTEDMSPIYLTGDEDLARAADTMKAGHLIRVTGTLKSATIPQTAINRRDFKMTFSHFDVDAPALRR